MIGEGSGAAEGKAEGVDPNARLSLYNHARRARAARRRVTRGHAASLEEGDQQLFDAEGEPIPEAAGAPTPLAHTVWDVTAESSRVLMHGYLFKRSTSVRKDWKRRWFFLRGGVLYYTRSHRVRPGRGAVCGRAVSPVRAPRPGAGAGYAHGQSVQRHDCQHTRHAHGGPEALL